MKHSYKLAAALAVALGIGVAAAAFAHPGPMGSAGGAGMMMGGGMSGGMGAGMMHGGQMGPAAQLMTPEERAALQEKMHGAKTVEERQKLAEATRTEMQKRAKEKGITLPEPHAMSGPGHSHGVTGPRQ